jgi:hypothetical protein
MINSNSFENKGLSPLAKLYPSTYLAPFHGTLIGFPPDRHFGFPNITEDT